MLDFPANPQVGDVFQSWKWDGEKWASIGGVGPPGPAGPQGPQGVAGAPGATGPTGPAVNNNRVDNGDMSIDQHNGGANFPITVGTMPYGPDRWGSQSNGKLTAGRNYNGTPHCPGFGYFFGVQTTGTGAAPAAGDTNYTQHGFEADAMGDLGFGAAGASPVTLSFWARSSLTGNFSVALQGAGPTNWRTYVTTYSLPTANTWTKITITFPGDTAGSWAAGGNGPWGYLVFDFGTGATNQTSSLNAWATQSKWAASGAVKMVATTNAKWAVTGIKLEPGSVATPFVIESIDKRLARCQRYYEISTPTFIWFGYAETGYSYYHTSQFTVQKRDVPTMTMVSVDNAVNFAMTPTLGGADLNGVLVYNTCTLTGSQNYFQYGWIASAEL